MINILDPSQCCGCTACASICAHDAITMQPDVLGFLYPKVDKSKCVECGLCEKVCAFNENYDRSLNLPQPTAYGARHKDMNEVATSRSGAAFIAISDHILENGGVVYGAGYTDHFRVVHKRAETKEQRNEFKGSKYVQSDLTGIFQQVKQDLRNGRTVLFSGTPCQTAGLNSYVGNKLRENLFLIDIVCHGVPSPYIWRDYLAYLEKKHGSEIKQVSFRDKDLFGWTAHWESFKFNDGTKPRKTYTYTFYKHIMFRHSCGVCKYTNLQRPSDITIADFWGWQKTDPNINADDKGLSLVLCHTEKGQNLFDNIAEQMIVIPAKLENCLQANLQHPSAIHPQRMDFERDYAQKGFKYTMKKHADLVWSYKKNIYITRIKSIIKRILRLS
jgi:coenzyme F420-reducing hydrogenase beta subunit